MRTEKDTTVTDSREIQIDGESQSSYLISRRKILGLGAVGALGLTSFAWGMAHSRNNPDCISDQEAFYLKGEHDGKKEVYEEDGIGPDEQDDLDEISNSLKNYTNCTKELHQRTTIQGATIVLGALATGVGAAGGAIIYMERVWDPKHMDNKKDPLTSTAE